MPLIKMTAMHLELLQFMRDNPGNRVPVSTLAEKHGYTAEGVSTARKRLMQQHRDLVPGKRGGPNFALPEKTIEKIREIWERTPDKGFVDTEKAITEIAKATGRGITGPVLRLRLNKIGGKTIIVKDAGKFARAEDVAKMLAQKGIEAKTKVYAKGRR